MLYKLVSPPTVENHAENLIHLFVHDANGAPIAGARVRVWAGPPPSGTPAYWTDDLPFRSVNAAGMLEFITVNGLMPESRDYWMQVLGNDGMPQSDPVQFHFPQASSIWITATLQQAGAPSGGVVPAPSGGVTPPLNVQMDPRLAAMHVSVATVTNLGPGEVYWKIISVQYQDENESSQNHNIYYTVLDQNGMPAPGVPIQMDWIGRDPKDVPSQVFTDGNGTANTAMYHGNTGWRPEIEPGPYAAWVGDPDLRGGSPTKTRGERLVGAGLPMNRHVNFIVTWRRATAGGAPPPPPPPAPVTPPPAPPTGTSQTYTVQPGDTLSRIAQKFGVTVAAIVAANHIANPNLIKPGQVFIIPPKS